MLGWWRTAPLAVNKVNLPTFFSNVIRWITRIKYKDDFMGKYISKNLGRDEQVVLQAKVHWACLIPSIISSLVIIGIPGLIGKLIKMATTELGFTNKNFIGKVGLINTKVFNSPLAKINNVSVESGFWGKIFGYGTIHVDTASGAYDFKFIARADNFRSNLLNAIEQYEQDKIKKQAQEIANAMKNS